MDDKQSLLDALKRQTEAMGIEAPSFLHLTPITNCCVENAEWLDHLPNGVEYASATLRGMSEGFQGPILRPDELGTIRKLLEQCTIDATRREVILVLETACSHPEECIDCPYKNSLGECNRNERIADILLNRFGRVK